MKYPIILASLLALSLTACGKKEEAVEAPAPEATMPAPEVMPAPEAMPAPAPEAMPAPAPEAMPAPAPTESH